MASFAASRMDRTTTNSEGMTALSFAIGFGSTGFLVGCSERLRRVGGAGSCVSVGRTSMLDGKSRVKKPSNLSTIEGADEVAVLGEPDEFRLGGSEGSLRWRMRRTRFCPLPSDDSSSPPLWGRPPGLRVRELISI